MKRKLLLGCLAAGGALALLAGCTRFFQSGNTAKADQVEEPASIPSIPEESTVTEETTLRFPHLITACLCGIIKGR